MTNTKERDIWYVGFLKWVQATFGEKPKLNVTDNAFEKQSFRKKTHRFMTAM